MYKDFLNKAILFAHEIHKIIAVLHDTIETEQSALGTLIDMEYIQKIAESRNIRAIRVKLADLNHNSSEERMKNITDEAKAKSLMKRYTKAKEILVPLYEEISKEK